MDFKSYQSLFEKILSGEIKETPYNNPVYITYTQLNQSRMKRWLKSGKLNTGLITLIEQISEQQNWVLITEPWCGDASHTVPFIVRLAEINPLICLEIQLRDTHSEIESYLTNAARSIPKLIIRDKEGKDLGIWGPRPKACQELFFDLKNSSKTKEEQKIELQKWYNEDQGASLQEELLELLVG